MPSQAWENSVPGADNTALHKLYVGNKAELTKQISAAAGGKEQVWGADSFAVRWYEAPAADDLVVQHHGDSYHNLVEHQSIPDHMIGPAAMKLVTRFDAMKRGFSWVVGPMDQPQLEVALQNRAMFLEDDQPVMFIPLQSAQEPAAGGQAGKPRRVKYRQPTVEDEETSTANASADNTFYDHNEKPEDREAARLTKDASAGTNPSELRIESGRFVITRVETPDDVATWVRTWAYPESAKSSGVTHWKKIYTRLLNTLPTTQLHMFLLERQTSPDDTIKSPIVGCGMVHCYGGVAALHSITIKPDFRGRTLGRGLVQYALAKAREMGYSMATATGTTTSINLLHKSGFRDMGRVKQYTFKPECYAALSKAANPPGRVDHMFSEEVKFPSFLKLGPTEMQAWTKDKQLIKELQEKVAILEKTVFNEARKARTREDALKKIVSRLSAPSRATTMAAPTQSAYTIPSSEGSAMLHGYGSFAVGKPTIDEKALLEQRLCRKGVHCCEQRPQLKEGLLDHFLHGEELNTPSQPAPTVPVKLVDTSDERQLRIQAALDRFLTGEVTEDYNAPLNTGQDASTVPRVVTVPVLPSNPHREAALFEQMKFLERLKTQEYERWNAPTSQRAFAEHLNTNKNSAEIQNKHGDCDGSLDQNNSKSAAVPVLRGNKPYLEPAQVERTKLMERSKPEVHEHGGWYGPAGSRATDEHLSEDRHDANVQNKTVAQKKTDVQNKTDALDKSIPENEPVDLSEFVELVNTTDSDEEWSLVS